MSKLKKILLLIKFLNSKRIVLGRVDKVDVLIFGYSPQNFTFKKKIKTKQLTNEIYLRILILSFFELLFSKKEKSFKQLSNIYFTTLINRLSPKVSIGHEVNANIFKLKKIFPKKIAIAYQYVHWKNYIKSSLFKIVKKDSKCDYFFIFDKSSKRHLNFLKTKFVISGSVKNNEVIVQKEKKKYDIMFISEYRNQEKNNYDKIELTKKVKKIQTLNTEANIFILKILNNFIKKTGLRLCVALASTRVEKRKNININDELNFYSKYLDNFYYEKNLNSYELAAKSNICISISSTLGPELLARKMKVFFIMNKIYKSLNWEFLPRKKGKFWYRGDDQNIIISKIKYLLNLKINDWNKVLKKSKISFEYDKDNFKLKKLVYSLVKK